MYLEKIKITWSLAQVLTEYYEFSFLFSPDLNLRALGSSAQAGELMAQLHLTRQNFTYLGSAL